MFFAIQRVVGSGFLLFGLILSFTGGYPLGFALLFGGFALISLASIAESVRGTYLLQAGIPHKKDQIGLIVRESPVYRVQSESLTLVPGSGAEYPIVRLDNELYIRAKAFVRYMTQNETEYVFAFPGREPFALHCAPAYFPGAELFAYNEQAFIVIRELGLDVRFEGDRVWFEAKPEEPSDDREEA